MKWAGEGAWLVPRGGAYPVVVHSLLRRRVKFSIAWVITPQRLPCSSEANDLWGLGWAEPRGTGHSTAGRGALGGTGHCLGEREHGMQ